MYSARLKTLSRAYKRAEESNSAYLDALNRQRELETQLNFLAGLHEQLKTFSLAVADKEREWRDAVLAVLSSEISNDLSYVYPSDGYQVNLSARVLRGKIHIEATVTSTFAKDFPGKIKGTQGRLFQQIVSSSSLVNIMRMVGVQTIYVDEAFSGSAKKNMGKLNKLLQSFEERGLNMVIIAQDSSMADGLKANRLILSRSLDNKTTITKDGVGV